MHLETHLHHLLTFKPTEAFSCHTSTRHDKRNFPPLSVHYLRVASNKSVRWCVNTPMWPRFPRPPPQPPFRLSNEWRRLSERPGKTLLGDIFFFFHPPPQRAELLHHSYVCVRARASVSPIPHPPHPRSARWSSDAAAPPPAWWSRRTAETCNTDTEDRGKSRSRGHRCRLRVSSRALGVASGFPPLFPRVRTPFGKTCRFKISSLCAQLEKAASKQIVRNDVTLLFGRWDAFVLCKITNMMFTLVLWIVEISGITQNTQGGFIIGPAAAIHLIYMPNWRAGAG